MDSFIVKFWSRALTPVRWLSPLAWIWFLIPRTRTHGWVDLWVLLNFGVSIATLFLAARPSVSVLVVVLLTYGALRLLEVVVYQTTVVLLDPHGGPLTRDFAVRSYRRTVVLALHNYFEVIFWFAAIYSALRERFGDAAPILGTPTGTLYFSTVTMTTLGYGDIAPKDTLSRSVVAIHLSVAVFMTLIILARFVASLPTPRTLDDSERPSQ